MYKATASGLRRATGVHKITPVAVAVEEDLIPTAANMTMRQVQEERQKLTMEMVRTDQEIAVARREGDLNLVKFLGSRRAALQSRMSLMHQRRLQLVQDAEYPSFRAAVKEIVPEEMLQAIYKRHTQLRDQEVGA
jgi:hypothetical protein